MKVFSRSNSVCTQDNRRGLRRLKGSTSKDLKEDLIYNTKLKLCDNQIKYQPKLHLSDSFLLLRHSFVFLCRFSFVWFLAPSSTITGQGGGYRPSPAVSGWPPDFWLLLSQINGLACPRQLGFPRWCGAPLGSGCAACRRRWAVGHTGPGALGGAQYLSFLEGKHGRGNIENQLTWYNMKEVCLWSTLEFTSALWSISPSFISFLGSLDPWHNNFGLHSVCSVYVVYVYDVNHHRV